jgi:ATP-dependent DNA helicase RecG
LEEEMSEGVHKGVKLSDGQHDAILKLIHEGVNEGVTEGVNENVYDIINILINVAGLNAVEIASRTKRGLSTVERYIRLLRKKEIVEFKGVPKTGGYYLTQKAKDKLK